MYVESNLKLACKLGFPEKLHFLAREDWIRLKDNKQWPRGGPCGISIEAAAEKGGDGRFGVNRLEDKG
ncbi:hypothetical protein CEXT_120821 [Caerostris extrusa]|uniref:Uncharacterized protein n=1 Tax=Caerostris extrusa TaxID=172846 RepID=A0AAV4PLT4_CAEEX|nr:hypothetical protein CEXT_120821 [Caerostris extrusa]